MKNLKQHFGYFKDTIFTLFCRMKLLHIVVRHILVFIFFNAVILTVISKL